MLCGLPHPHVLFLYILKSRCFDLLFATLFFKFIFYYIMLITIQYIVSFWYIFNVPVMGRSFGCVFSKAICNAHHIKVPSLPRVTSEGSEST